MSRFLPVFFAAALALTLAAAAGCGAADRAEQGPPPAPPVEADSGAVARSPSGPSGEASSDDAHTVLFLGNSLTAGYGLDPTQAYPHLIQQKIDSLGWDFDVVNAGLSGETTAGGRRRVSWLLRRPVDVLVLALGGNDALRGVDPGATRANLQAIIDTTRARYPQARIVLAGMQAPPNMGADYTEPFAAVYPDLARARDVALVPFLLEGVGGVAELNQPDGIHPTAAGQRRLAENVWDTLRPVLDSLREDALATSLRGAGR